MIFHEMFHQRRIIPLDGSPHANVTQWNGEPRGRWDGDTLVVESRNFRTGRTTGGTILGAPRPASCTWSSGSRASPPRPSTTRPPSPTPRASRAPGPCASRWRRSSRRAAWRRRSCSSSPATRGLRGHQHPSRRAGAERRGAVAGPEPAQAEPAHSCFNRSAGSHAGVPSSYWLSVRGRWLEPSAFMMNSSAYGCGWLRTSGDSSL